MSETNQKKGLDINAKSFITAIIIIFALMCGTYALTFVIPSGEYARIVDANGDIVLDTASGFQYVEGGMPFWKWILSPVLVLVAEGSGTILAVIAFLLVIGGVFNGLDKCGLMQYMLDKIVDRFGASKYHLMAMIIFFFMALGSFIGSFEECVPLVPIVVALSISLGWDDLTGLGMSLLAIGCGFAAGVCNPFTVGVAQNLVGLPMFSGIWLRLVSFIVIYSLLFIFVKSHAKKVEKQQNTTVAFSHSTDVSQTLYTEKQTTFQMFVSDEKKDNALKYFGGILLVGVLVIFSSVLITALQDFTMIIVAVMFLVAGIISILTTGMSAKEMGTYFWNGVISIFPAVFMILMASSIKYTLVEAKILDTLLYSAVGIAETLPKEFVILFVYLLVLVMNFFISSGSAKAFLLMPLIVPLAQIFDISAQLCVMAFAFGDGFSNVLYPTNAVLLISIGLVNVNYVKWFKWTWKFQLLNLIVTSLLLLVGLAIGYR